MKLSSLQKRRQSGQIGVIVLLTMAGMLTIGLSLASRTTQESLLTGKETESARVFNAAEEGIEEALSTSLDFEGDSTSGSLTLDNIDVNYQVTKVDHLATKVFEGVSVGVDVTGAHNDDDLQIYFAQTTDCSKDPAAIIASVFYEDNGTTRVKHYPITANSNCRDDGFESAHYFETEVDGVLYMMQDQIPLENNSYLVRIKPIYNDTQLYVAGASGFDLPVQYYSIRSSASSDTGDENRIVQVNRTLATAPSIFDNALFSGTTIIK